MNSKRTIIIAEAGVNHNGSLETALRMIDAAKECGADYIKFQTFKAEKLVDRNARKAEYQNRNLKDRQSTQLEMLKKLELTEEDFRELKRHCEERGIGFLSSPFDLESIDFLKELGMDYLKIPSGEITNLPYLRKAAGAGMPIILSTGMADIPEVAMALQVLLENGMKREDVTLLQCTTEYPAPYCTVNLRVMDTLRERFRTETGYSDHTKGTEVAIAAAARGATVIEKHFTLDKSMPGPDHVASLNPEELKQMVVAIRHIVEALGNGVKEPSAPEQKNIAVARKSIVARRAIKAGEIFTEENLTTKRPGCGISPMEWDKLLGKTSSRSFAQDEQITL